MVISSIEREPFVKFSGLREIKITKIVRKGAFAKYTSCGFLYEYGMQKARWLREVGTFTISLGPHLRYLITRASLIYCAIPMAFTGVLRMTKPIPIQTTPIPVIDTPVAVNKYACSHSKVRPLSLIGTHIPVFIIRL